MPLARSRGQANEIDSSGRTQFRTVVIHLRINTTAKYSQGGCVYLTVSVHMSKLLER